VKSELLIFGIPIQAVKRLSGGLMRNLSVGRSLALRQILFLGLLLALGMSAYLAVVNLHDLAHVVAMGTPDQMVVQAASLEAKADIYAYSLLVELGLSCIVVLCVSLPVIHYTTTKPIETLAAQMSQLASGDTNIDISDDKRPDEIGQIARSLGVLRDAVKTNNALVQEIRARDDREAKLVHEVAIHARIEKFSAELSAAMKRFGAMAKRMAEASETMILTARNASEGTSQAKIASANAAGDVSSVANASEQLLISIEEISQQVVQSTTVVQKAVQEAVATNAGMGRLSVAARRVGDVVSLISRIAAQTNLLALNATIEAARAGEAGRGFAVVAQEVKTLATQTAKATQEISGLIADMQGATETSVQAIDLIARKISEVEHISMIIASAVHEQGASTQEITRNVRSAASGTAAMSSFVENVAVAVTETNVSVDSVVNLVRELNDLAASMSERMKSFAEGLQIAI
jgi:methyl-accepting chemotaxis protein